MANELVAKHWPHLAALADLLEELDGRSVQASVLGDLGGSGGSRTEINVQATTNANPWDIASDVAWVIRTSGR